MTLWNSSPDGGKPHADFVVNSGTNQACFFKLLASKSRFPGSQVCLVTHPKHCNVHCRSFGTRWLPTAPPPNTSTSSKTPRAPAGVLCALENAFAEESGAGIDTNNNNAAVTARFGKGTCYNNVYTLVCATPSTRSFRQLFHPGQPRCPVQLLLPLEPSFDPQQQVLTGVARQCRNTLLNFQCLFHSSPSSKRVLRTAK